MCLFTDIIYLTFGPNFQFECGRTTDNWWTTRSRFLFLRKGEACWIVSVVNWYLLDRILEAYTAFSLLSKQSSEVERMSSFVATYDLVRQKREIGGFSDVREGGFDDLVI